ncbi:NAD(P)H-hydrate dehydratase [Oenococcus kitaharae]|uniref:ADP-dependent (S)-NAD(P)H-hydrate dehydratase n=1 Tax=Oenococcus kitaharae DSM 17330 TaxID=1045004 RepID=G9WGL4_9LACO|nr:NAD(P)H-hydrate dehydratase [Oenococcus kitaharae]EHN59841.1 YjeF-like protein [Oenococcus kitaharae DSM 17330]OEY83703.1 sugar kinase [Oenococcus kitaharae]OEY85502.1 sugar kinase [Oenococcus kitaharae]OEY86355.1 sugar kinase [Oenococcus kitaharae]
MQKKILKSDILKEVIKERPSHSNKTNYGRILLICGSKPFGGAAIMATKSVVNTGAGLVTLASDPINRTAMLSTIPEAMFADYYDRKNLSNMTKKADVILIGSGLEDSDFSEELIQETFSILTANQFLVIDGTALSMIGKRHLRIPQKPTSVLTPHQGEWERMTGLKVSEQTADANFLEMQKIGADYLILKSNASEIYAQKNPDQYNQLTIGGPFQAVGGMGDTLAGIVAGFLGQFRHDPFLTIQAAAYLHSWIAKQLSKQNYIALPTRISDQIPSAMRQITLASEQNN